MIEKDYEVFIDLILKYNKVHNITGAKDKAAVVDNIEDSIYPIKFLPIKDIKTAIDIGAGAGFPGLILAIELPNIHFTLFEPIAKKSSFLHLIKTTLGLKNVTVSTKRVEQAKAFEVDLITSRAVTNTDMLINLCKEYITPKTMLLFYKGERVDEEVTNLKNYKIHKKDKRNYLLIKDIITC
ncbi:MAG TPA: 16S rRNA (guanine(527)-N(7))-methyltransferase RsmG [Sulfurospirillum arcachonense]|nr:16S rRNA (guanine(527)-N(7))-methyltransferase RsmG [Sulfurospirillum arcachonense]HIP44193.1 16S rRNA (guanine(527)-N(7))-methyltransferase RsmG [Sulfurospirillum arcachonense]